MQIFKFGGASVKDAENIRNVSRILETFAELKKVLVISAIGKTTNMLEEAVNLYFQQNDKFKIVLQKAYQKHVDIAIELGIPDNHLFYHKLEKYFNYTVDFLTNNKETSYTFVYDQVVPLGELFSTLLVSSYLEYIGMSTCWIDAREMIVTNASYTEAKVNFELSGPKIVAATSIPLDLNQLVITQGFIGRNEEGFTTTLGREGSDYSAAVLAYCLDAEKVVIWKDVPAVLNADPRLFSDTIKLNRLSYREAIEMTYYGAQVIHPKTIKPLQNKNIPLQVRSFIDLHEEGTYISTDDDKNPIKYPPIIVYKTDQALISISVKDFSFVTEDNLSIIFQCFSKHGLRMNMTHNGAITFSVCTEYKAERIKALTAALANEFIVKYNNDLEMLTIRHYNEEKIDLLTKEKEILLQQKTRNTVRFLMRKKNNV